MVRDEAVGLLCGDLPGSSEAPDRPSPDTVIDSAEVTMASLEVLLGVAAAVVLLGVLAVRVSVCLLYTSDAADE